MQFSPENSPVPSTVSDCLGLSPDSLDSFYCSSDLTPEQEKSLPQFLTAGPERRHGLPPTHQAPDATEPDGGEDAWMSAEGIVDLQRMLLEQIPSPSSCSSSGGSEQMSSSDAEEDEASTAEREEIRIIMEMPAKHLSAAQKKIRRRELNRLAAQRSRGKKRTANQALGQEVKDLAKRNEELKSSLDRLIKEKEIYLKAIKRHFNHSTPTHRPTYSYATPLPPRYSEWGAASEGCNCAGGV